MEKPIFTFSKIKPPIAVVGLGIAGEAALDLLLSAGVSRSEIATFDDKNPADFNDPDHLIRSFRPKTLVVSPGVALSKLWIQSFQNAGGIITSELSLACQVLTTERIIGITGSLGKSTVASLLESGLNSFSKCGFVGGNLGLPLSVYVKKILAGDTRADWIVLELSSYNLENCVELHCDIGAITYLTPNHLERYQSLSHYYKTKWHLSEITSGPMILNSNGGDLSFFAKGFSHPGGLVFTDQNDTEIKDLNPNESQLLGAHNRDNFALACKIALKAGWPTTSIQAMKSFAGLPHRVENLGVHNGVLFVNDSKATTIKSVITAAGSLRASVNGCIHLLIGGKDKSLPWSELGVLSQLSPIKFYFFGECRKTAHDVSALLGEEFLRLADAIDAAKKSAQSNDLILLSPGGTSLDEFKNFEERGSFFKSRINSNP